MLADEPLTSFKTGSNLVRAIDAANDDMDNDRNSISTRLQKSREPSRVDRQLELKTNTRSGIASFGDNSRLRRQRRRMRLLRQRCRQGDSDACQRLRKLIKQQSQDLEQFDEDRLDLDDESFNGDLVRSLDRRSSKRRQRRKKKKALTEEELLKKRERKLKKQQQKEERRKKRKERREKRRLMKEQRRKEKRRKMEEAKAAGSDVTGDVATSVEKRHTLRVRSVTETTSPKCQFKMVDSCTWPHCNPSCPKLKNSETGEISKLTSSQQYSP